MQINWQHQGAPVSMKHFLTTHGISMRLIKAIKHGSGMFIVNDEAEVGAITIEDGDIAGIELPAEAADPEVAVSDEPLAVVYEDANWLVVNKPAGVSSVPGPTNRTDTLVNRIKGHLVATKAENLKPHLITRLDRDTSGLVLVAKHRVAQGMMAWQPVAKTFQKTYRAWVSGGALSPVNGTIEAPIGRVDESPRRQVTDDGQMAITRYRVQATHGDVTEVQLTLVTGRTHQIRVHFTHWGHPLLGDALYGGDQTLIQRQALHAATMTFHDPFSNQQLTFEAPLPTDLVTLVNKLQ